MLAHLRTEAYPVYRDSYYPPGRHSDEGNVDFVRNKEIIEETKKGL